MGSGKSTLGAHLAEKLACRFVDLDEVIKRESGMSIAELFVSEGEKVFRARELKALKRILESDDQMVLALGGGTFCNKKAIGLIKRCSVSIYLQRSERDLYDTLRYGKRDRPIIIGLSDTELKRKIKSLMNVRRLFYKQAHYTVQNNKSIERVLARIGYYLRKNR